MNRSLTCRGLAAAAALTAVIAVASVSVADTEIPAVISTDPVPDARYPASMVVLHILTHGRLINGVAYVPEGAGPHPVFVLCHGLPGNEKNLDLAQAVRRAGWVAVTFNYRGTWGSPGKFSFMGNLDDTAAVLAYIRNVHHDASLRADPRRIVLAGHSMGGWVAAEVGAHDNGLAGVVLISAWDPSGPSTHAQTVATMADNMETLAGVTPDSMANEVESHRQEMALRGTVEGLKSKPLLVVSANDGLAPGTDALMSALRAAGDDEITAAHIATDHSYSDRRIELEARVIDWLQTLKTLN
jgi:uncharacterized protein